MSKIRRIQNNQAMSEELEKTDGYQLRWDPKFVKKAFKLALMGATDKEIAEILDVNLMTFDYWKRTKPEFMEALQNAKKLPDAKTAQSLYKCANGYYYKEEVAHVVGGKVVITEIKRYKGPDAWAAYKILSVRQRRDWAETSKVEITNTNVNINKFDFNGLSKEELRFIASIGLKQLREHGGDDQQN